MVAAAACGAWLRFEGAKGLLLGGVAGEKAHFQAFLLTSDFRFRIYGKNGLQKC